MQPFPSKLRNKKIKKSTKIKFSQKVRVIEQNGFHHQKGNQKLHLVTLKIFPIKKTVFCKMKKLKIHFFQKKHFSQKVRVIETNGFQHLKEHQKVGLEATQSLPTEIWIFWGKNAIFTKKSRFMMESFLCTVHITFFFLKTK